MSPSPRAAFTTTTSRAPLTGSALNAIAEASAGTMSCTSTAIRGVPVMPRCLRYTAARSEYTDRQHSSSASTIASTPPTSSTVSCWPANDASPESSPIADDRTATRGSRSPTRLARSAYDAATSSCSRARAATSPSSAWRSSSNADTSRQKPGGTRKEVARRPRFAVFPPTVVASREPASPNQATCMAGESRSIAP